MHSGGRHTRTEPSWVVRVRAEDAAAAGSREQLPPESLEGAGAAPRGPRASGLRNRTRAVSAVQAAPSEASDAGESSEKTQSPRGGWRCPSGLPWRPCAAQAGRQPAR